MSGHPSRRIAFLLAQLGSDSAVAFERALAPLGITPAEAGLLRLIGRRPGIGQKDASGHLGVGPSRVVAVLDRLERHGLVERRPGENDRRRHALHLSAEGKECLAALRPIAQAHEEAFTAELGADDLDRLARYLGAIADSRGLSRDLHRGTQDRADSPRTSRLRHRQHAGGSRGGAEGEQSRDPRKEDDA